MSKTLEKNRETTINIFKYIFPIFYLFLFSISISQSVQLEQVTARSARHFLLRGSVCIKHM